MEQNFRHLNNGAVPYGNVPVEPAAATGGMDGGAVPAAQYAGLESGLKEIFGEEFAIADAESQRMLLDYLERVTTQNEKLTAILERDPRLAQLFLDLVNGKRNAHARNLVAIAFGGAGVFKRVEGLAPVGDAQGNRGWV